MGFSNPILGGTVLVRPAIKSPNYVPGVAGWSINRDGSAEFQNLISRGTIIAGAPNGKRIVIDNATGEIDIYDAANNLIAKLDGTTGLQVFDPVTGIVTVYGPAQILATAPIAPLNRFQVVFNDANNEGDLLLNGRHMPRGVMDVKEGTADVATVGAGEVTIITGNAVSFDGFQRARIVLHIRGISGTVAGDVFGIQIKEGATQLQQGQWETQTINVAKRGITVEYVTPNPPAPGNHTYSATMLRQVGTGIITAQGAAGRPIQLITEQVGG